MSRRSKKRRYPQWTPGNGMPREDKKWAFLYYWKILGDSRLVVDDIKTYLNGRPWTVPILSTELRFAPKPFRRWRFDWFFLPEKIAIEVQGIGSKKSGHTTFTGYMDDCEKMRDAQELGWIILYVVPQELEQNPTKIINQVLRILKGRQDGHQ